MRILYLGEFKIFLLFPLVMSIFTATDTICDKYISNSSEDKNISAKTGIKLSYHLFSHLFLMFLSESSIIIFFIIQEINTKKEKKTLKKQKSLLIPVKFSQIKMKVDDNYIFFPGKTNEKIKIILLLMLCAFIDYISSVCSNILTGKFPFSDVLKKFSLIILNSLFSKFILKYEYHRHHLLAIIINFLGMVGLCINENKGQKGGQTSKFNFTFVILILVFNFLSGLLESIEKYIMEYKYVSPFAVISFEGFFGLIYTSASLIGFNYINCNDNFEKYHFCEKDVKVKNFSGIFHGIFKDYHYYLPVILFYFSLIFFNVFRLLTNHQFSPTHRCIADAIGPFLYWLYRLFVFRDFKDYNSRYKIIAVISYLINTLAAFIYLELLNTELFKLDKNTRIKIKLRNKEEVNIMEKEIEAHEQENYNLELENADDDNRNNTISNNNDNNNNNNNDNNDNNDNDDNNDINNNDKSTENYKIGREESLDQNSYY